MKSYNGLLQSQYNWVKYNPWYSIWTTRVSQRFSPCFFRQISSPLATHSMYSLAPEAEAKCQRHFQPFPTPWGTTPQKNQKWNLTIPPFGKGENIYKPPSFQKRFHMFHIVLGSVYQNRTVLSWHSKVVNMKIAILEKNSFWPVHPSWGIAFTPWYAPRTMPMATARAALSPPTMALA